METSVDSMVTMGNAPRLWLRALRYVGQVLLLGVVSIMLLTEIPFPPPSDTTRFMVRLVFVLDIILCLGLPACLEQVWMRRSHGVYLKGEWSHRFSLRVATIVLIPSAFIALSAIMALAVTYDIAMLQVLRGIGNFFTRSSTEALSTSNPDLAIGLLFVVSCAVFYFCLNYLNVRGWMAVTRKIMVWRNAA